MNLRTPSRRLAATLLLVAAAGTTLASCGDDKKADAKSANVTKIQGISIGNAKDLKVKPTIDIPDVDPPTKAITEDLVVGKGETLKSGKQLTARYVGVGWTSNTEFDASWGKTPNTAAFPIADGSVIAGWVKQLPGMKVGGRRLLIVPPADAYGEQGSEPTIAKNETLVFIVDAVKIEDAPAAPAAGAGGSEVDQQALQDAIQQQLQQQGGATQAP